MAGVALRSLVWSHASRAAARGTLLSPDRSTEVRREASGRSFRVTLTGLAVGDRFGVVLLESDFYAHRHRYCDQQADDAEQYCAADKRDDHDNRVDPRRLPKHDRADDIVNRQ